MITKFLKYCISFMIDVTKLQSYKMHILNKHKGIC